LSLSAPEVKTKCMGASSLPAEFGNLLNQLEIREGLTVAIWVEGDKLIRGLGSVRSNDEIYQQSLG